MSGQVETTITLVTTSPARGWSPEVRRARQEGTEFIDTLAVLREVPVEQCWLETNANPTGTKRSDINRGDGDRGDIR